jgi:hypothetical protein
MVTFWFMFEQMAIPYSMGILCMGLFFSSKYLGFVMAREQLKDELTHPRHQSINKQERGSTNLVMISHSDTVGFKENIVKNCIISMSGYAALASLFFVFVGLAGPVLESKLSLSLTYF